MKKLLLIAVFGLVAAAGCSGQVPVETVRSLYDAIGPEHRVYVKADARLNESQKRIRLQTLASFERMLTEAEK